MINVTSLVNNQDCCGCGACANKCPVGAISIRENEDGFLTPVVDESKCTNCGLCLDVCPSINVKYNNSSAPSCYAAMADKSLRMQSSSGGLFSLLAEYILDSGGYVCGAAFDDNWDVHHIIIDNKNDLYRLRGSKYVQSHTEDCYRKIKEILDDNKYVLFSGCPCQVAGLYSFLGKEYDKLYTIDLICHGAPSRAVWKKYLNENFDINSIENISFRNKVHDNWRAGITITKKDGSEFYELDEINDYYKLFIPCVSLMPHCSDCKYTDLRRQGDITLGDFWQIEQYDCNLNDGLGTTMLLVNNDKGKFLIDKIKSALVLYKEVPLEFALSTFNVAVSHSWPVSPNRNYFFKNLSRRSIKKLVKECNNEYHDCAINNLWWHANYGAILTAYALQETLEEMNYSTKVINYIPGWYKRDIFPGSIAENFARKYLNLTNECVSIKDLMDLNGHFDNFLVGSDQVFRYGAEILWNPFEWHDYKYIFYNSFVNFDKNKIACAASFGRSLYEGPDLDKEKVKFYLKNFNHISVREDDGVDICKNTFNVDAQMILDPVFLVNKQKYTELISNSEVDTTGKIAYYLITQSDEKDAILEYYSNKFNKPLFNTKSSQTIEDWVSAISKCDLLITDSFHGVCFSLIFNKPFIHVKHPNDHVLPYSRFTSIFKLIQTEINSILTLEDCINYKPENIVFDWQKINNILDTEIHNSKAWLKNSVENKHNKQYTNSDVMLNNLLIDDIHYKDEIGCLHWCLSQEQARIAALQNEIAENNRISFEHIKELTVLQHHKVIISRYYRYKLLSKLLFGKKRRRYKEKARIYHEKVRTIRRLKKDLSYV